jgi:hypothetical protein
MVSGLKLLICDVSFSGWVEPQELRLLIPMSRHFSAHARAIQWCTCHATKADF